MSIARLSALLIAGFLLANSSVAISAEDPTLFKATALVKTNNAKAAYELLEPLESERAGDPAFDYVFGIAAIDSGNVTRGVFALERVLAVEPNNAQARAEIAKAYYQLGENETAKLEFQNVLNQQPPEQARQTINRFLSAIDKNLGLATRYGAFLDFGIGYDSNVNSATGSSSIAIPVFGGTIFNLSNSARELSSSFMSLTGGASVSYPVSKDFAVFGTVSGYKKLNWSQDQFDTDSIDFNVGGQYKKGPNAYTLSAQDSSYYVNDNRFRHAYGLSGQWQRDVNESNQLSLYFQAAHLEYPGQNIRDADRYVVGTGWGHAFAGDKSPVMFLSAYVGQENERASNASFLGNDLYGVRAGGQFSLNPKTVVYGAVSYEKRDYGGDDPLFLRARNDDQYDFAIGMRYFPGYAWTIRPQISYTWNDSNIVINEYDRTVISINFRHDFNW
ncbi:MAG TPA: surface lipoprotein assembly modifier [Methylophilaceae bacterium]|nr:surface lipoprotein assembly modifier [Methylophilaceae bacterium]